MSNWTTSESGPRRRTLSLSVRFIATQDGMNRASDGEPRDRDMPYRGNYADIAGHVIAITAVRQREWRLYQWDSRSLLRLIGRRWQGGIAHKRRRRP
jgi:hypothetical protein